MKSSELQGNNKLALSRALPRNLQENDLQVCIIKIGK